LTVTCYTAYGLTIASEIACPMLRKLPTVPETADVQIRYGAVPADLEGAVAKGVLYQAKPNQFLLKLDKIAAFLISNGNEVLIERAPEATDDEVLLFLFGSAFGALLHQRGLLVLHASAVETERGAVLFVGHSGNGKSTLAAALRKRGYRILADDVCALALDAAGNPIVLPGFPQLKLWADTAKKLEHETGSLRRVRPQLEKFALPVEDGFVDEPRPLFAIYHLISQNTQEFKMEAVEDARKFQMILFNTYRGRFLDGLEMRREHFKLATAAGKAARVLRVTRPSAPFLLEELADMVEKDFKQ
jgi:hypothetical protein